MPGQTPTFNSLRGDESIEELRDEVAKMQKTMNHMLRHLSSKNINEAGGWFVKQTELISKDGDVGMSTDDLGDDPVRFFAGGVDKDTAPWRVLQSGKMIATGALIQSADEYPKFVVDPAKGVFGVYKSADEYIEMDADFSGSPVINVVENGSVVGQVSSLSGRFRLFSPTNMDIVSNGDVNFITNNYLRVSTFAKIFGTSEGKDLLTALGEKVDTTSAYSTYAVNMTFDDNTRNLKLFAGDGTQIAIVNIPDATAPPETP